MKIEKVKNCKTVPEAGKQTKACTVLKMGTGTWQNEPSKALISQSID